METSCPPVSQDLYLHLDLVVCVIWQILRFGSLGKWVNNVVFADRCTDIESVLPFRTDRRKNLCHNHLWSVNEPFSERFQWSLTA